MELERTCELFIKPWFFTLLSKLLLCILKDVYICNSELDIAKMTEMLHISRTKFYYKVKGLTGENPSVFFKRYKLNRAAELLSDSRYNVSEIADLTGFSTLSFPDLG